MSRQLTYCLVADGGTDRLLEPIIDWSIQRLDPDVQIDGRSFAKRRGTLEAFFDRYDPDGMMTFVHRDAEGTPLTERLAEFDVLDQKSMVPVIPVRMSEAWILFDKDAISEAVGRVTLPFSVPRASRLEEISDPKACLDEMLLRAAGNPRGRRLKRFNREIVNLRVEVARRIRDFSPLDSLPAFRAFQNTLEERYIYRRHIQRESGGGSATPWT